MEPTPTLALFPGGLAYGGVGCSGAFRQQERVGAAHTARWAARRAQQQAAQ